MVNAPRAYWQTLGMARCAGVPLPRALAQGRLTRPDLSAMVARCQACSHTDACAAWLADPRHAHPPGFCGIGADIMALVPRTDGPVRP
jgi:hypothetical protein